jgi:hypothetical protein
MTDPLELPLKDIHLPAGISWWPPAPGWWILLALIILIVGLIYWWRQRQQRIRRSAVNMARLELDSLQSHYLKHQDARQFVADLSVLLRRLSISAFPRTETASLTGEAWLKFLDTPLQDHSFTSGPGRILVEAPYRPDVKAEEMQPLILLCQQWIDKLADRKAGQPS